MFINCTLKRSPELSHTEGIVDASAAITMRHGVQVEVLAVDHNIATGVYIDMTEHGWASDAWPRIFEQVLENDILVVAGPIWLGDNSSITKKIIERLYAGSSLTNASGRSRGTGRWRSSATTGRTAAR